MADVTPTAPVSDPVDLNKPATLADIVKLMAATSGSSNDQLVEAFSRAMAQNAPRRKVTMGEYDPKTPFHPNKKTAVHFTRPYLVNGLPQNWDVTTDQECALLNRIDRSGRYVDRLVEVILRDEGVDDMVEVRWPCETRDQQNLILGKSSRYPGVALTGFADLLMQVVEAQKAEDAEMSEAEDRPRKRTWANTVAYREAKARREVREAREAKTHPVVEPVQPAATF